MTSIYQQLVPAWLKYLNNMIHLMDLGIKYCEENNIAQEDILTAQLAPDMRG